MKKEYGTHEFLQQVGPGIAATQMGKFMEQDDFQF
jgi:hypothetical protein